MLGRDYSPDGKFVWTGSEWVPAQFVVRKKMLKVGIFLLIGGIFTTPLIIGFCIAPLGLLLMAFSVLQIRNTTPQLTDSAQIAEARGYVKRGFDNMGRQVYGPPDPNLYRHTAELMERKNRK